MEPMRLQKWLSQSGIASRRAAERLISDGKVKVNGRVITELGTKITPGADEVIVEGKLTQAEDKVYVLLNKPKGYVTTRSDPQRRPTVLALLGGVREYVYPVGRLDFDSEGLLLLTNDGEWAERVLHPRFGVEREYAVGLGMPLDEGQVAALRAGIPLDEGMARLRQPLRAATAVETQRLLALLDPPVDRLTWYRAVLGQGWKRQLRRMFGAVGVPIERLVRVRIGPLRLDDLPSGRARRLRANEVRALEGRR
jgi:23S rRNA pseudouridine2605 synthase